ncbi:hypothetical protein D7B24_008676 [Verticillium nonalfalfae]|uniref:Glucose-methanol-choline oxidoreductase N-terminal domain-containing protein n=1 Tax=Verticillium nonalfalfae TaxID=1051616 RepID=A0A3M9YJC7_9PEZI|nr:uncharacterized protein D7B24_008676 [Verticillium nonalfalfae]RNJ60295.1 hypothetical protein D7B24_008676 [Verticillium nonalfalfae]
MHIAALLALVPLVAALPSAEQPGLSPGLASSDVHRRFPTTRQEDVYDYIIVGAGVAGTTLANRLTANGLFRVLLLEAGQLDDQEDLITIPGNGANAATSKYNWNVTSTPSPATGNRSIALPIGRGVGGSSLINQMVFVRGSSGDFDRWKEFGNSGWGWSEIFKNLKKSEIFTRPNADVAQEFGATWEASSRGTQGAVHASYSPFWWPSIKNVVAAARELGIPILKDGYGGNNAGGFFTTHSVKPVENTRSSGRTAHYDVAAKRPNLKLIQYAHGSKIQVERGQAVGVEYIDTRTSTTKVVKAWKEVIVSAGAVFSPQILQLSGIGDAKELAAQGIKSVVDLPAVGRNLQDHPLVVAVHAITVTAPLSSANLSDTTFASEALALYKSNRTGPYANANAEFIMFLPTSTFSSQPAALRQAAQSQTVGQFLPADYPDSVRQSFAKQHRLLTAGLSSDAQTPLEIFWNEGTVVSGVQHPYSRGSVKLVSNNPLTPPAVDPGYLTNPLDLAIMVDGFKLARRIANTTAIAPLSPIEVFPGPTVATDADIEQYIRQNLATFAHYAGTCSVGPQNAGGVVDSDFRVYGVKNLRVVDASVIPLLPASHTSSTVYALAEKAATAILSGGSW